MESMPVEMTVRGKKKKKQTNIFWVKIENIVFSIFYIGHICTLNQIILIFH